MPTNREIKATSQTAGTPGMAEKPKTGNGSVSGANGGTTLFGGIQQKVTSRVDQQKNKAADGLGGIADVFRHASNELRNENEVVAQYVDMASDQLKRFADQIRHRGVNDMLDDVHAFARRRPALFIGGAFLVGIGIARFLKSSAERPSDDGFSDVDPMTRQSVPSYGSGLGEPGSY